MRGCTRAHGQCGLQRPARGLEAWVHAHGSDPAVPQARRRRSLRDRRRRRKVVAPPISAAPAHERRARVPLEADQSEHLRAAVPRWTESAKGAGDAAAKSQALRASTQEGRLAAPFTPRSLSRRSGSDGDHVPEGRKARERLALQLPHPLAGQVELVSDRLERPRFALEAEPQLEDPALPLGERVERLADALAPQRLLRLFERVRRLAVREQVAELTFVFGADGLVQRNRCLRGAQRLVYVLDRQSGRLRELFLRRLATELDLEAARGARQLLLPLDDVYGNADRAGMVRHGALHRLADPPGGVGRKLVAAPPVELLDRAVETERALLDQVQERDAEPAVSLRDRHDEAQVRLDHPPLRALVAALDRLREHDFLVRGQQLVPAD